MTDLMRVAQLVGEEMGRMWWFFLLSVFLVGLIKGYRLDLRIRDSIKRSGLWGIVLAVAVGMVSPLCACGILPVVVSLALAGTPLAPLLTLLVTSPIMGPDALLLTYRGLGADWALYKLLSAAFVGLGCGLCFHLLVRRGWLAGEQLLLKPVFREDGSAASAFEVGQAHGIALKTMQIVPRASRLRFILDRSLDAGLFIGKYLLLALVLEALIRVYLPVNWILFLVGQESLLSVLLAALVGLPLPAGQIPMIPILAGLLARGMDPGAALTLMVAGPVTGIPALLALFAMFRRPVVWVFAGLSLGFSILAGAGFQLLF